MELRNLKTFIKVAQTGSFSMAAIQLDYAQSTISSQINALEEELEVSLFIRSGKRILLSSEGQQLLKYAYEMVKLESEAKHLFTHDKKPKGTLRVGMLESISSSCYASVVTKHLEKYPGVNLQVTIGTTVQLMKLLEEGNLDIVLTLDIPINNPKFIRKSSKSVNILFFCHSDNEISNIKNLKLKDLLDERLLLTEKGCNYRQVFEEILANKKLEVDDFLEIGYIEIIKKSVLKNLGVSLLPEYNLIDIRDTEKIEILNIEECKIKLNLQVLTLEKQWFSPIQKNFITLFSSTVNA